MRENFHVGPVGLINTFKKFKLPEEHDGNKERLAFNRPRKCPRFTLLTYFYIVFGLPQMGIYPWV